MKNKKTFLILMILIILLSNIVYATDTEPIKVSLNDELLNFDVDPQIISGRTMVPLRVIFEELNLEVEWNNETRTVIGTDNNTIIKLNIDNTTAIVNGIEVILDVPATIINGRTMVPARFVTESTGSIVEWDETTRTVIITDKKNIIEADKNIYTQSYLQTLVDEADCESEILTFRAKSNRRRKGLGKIEGKYFDMYYPKDSEGQAVADFLSPHMDKVYMMLTDLYGTQATVEVHLIHEEDTKGLQEGKIRANERITYIWIEPNNDGEGGINNLSEFVHEINHNFFDTVNDGASNEMWINEANAKLISSLYIRDTKWDGEIETWSFYDPIVHDKDKLISLTKTDKHLRKPRAWGKADGELRQAQLTGLFLWSYIYNNNDLDTFKKYLTSLGNRNVIVALEEIMDKDIDTIEEEMLSYFETKQ